MRSVETAVQEIRDVGYTVIPNLIDGRRLRQAQADADALLGPTPIEMPGIDGKVIGRMCKGLFRKSRAFDDLYAHPTVLAVVRGVLVDPERKRGYLSFGSGVQLSTVMIKDVQPRENIRHMHRDDGWYPIARPRPPVVVNTLLALDPFTRETGGTLVVPGSHKWKGPVEQDHEHVVVEMDAGSILMFDGSLWHNNGANQTADRTRRALNMYYSQSWLRQVEGPYLGLTTDEVEELPGALRAIV
ncbi:MAG: phytanoyl-CoA dioxygenase family protein [Gammaproteobacteria bacterium]|nr:phytanoyl-CoA dioxygenase family protein [Gammaproteobacteria bacterium]